MKTLDEIFIEAGWKRRPITGPPGSLAEWRQLFEESLPELRQVQRQMATAERERRWQAEQAEEQALWRYLPRVDGIAYGWSVGSEPDARDGNLLALFPPAALDTRGIYIRLAVDRQADTLRLWASSGGPQVSVGPGSDDRILRQAVAWVLMPAIFDDLSAASSGADPDEVDAG